MLRWFLSSNIYPVSRRRSAARNIRFCARWFVQFGPSMTFVVACAHIYYSSASTGNVLVPLLFSEAVSLHPVYIIAAVLLFGAIWGFWGVFFAIPLASLVKAVITAFSEHRSELFENNSEQDISN